MATEDSGPATELVLGPDGVSRLVRTRPAPWRERAYKFDDDAKQDWLAVYAQTGVKTIAHKAAGITSWTFYEHEKNDEEFREAVRAALDEYKDTLRAEITRRGRDGWDEAVYAKGVRTIDVVVDEEGHIVMDPAGDGQTPLYKPATIRRFSDRLLELEVKRHCPEYREKGSLDISTGGGGGVMVPPPEMTMDEWDAMADEENEKALEPPTAIIDVEPEEVSPGGV